MRRSNASKGPGWFGLLAGKLHGGHIFPRRVSAIVEAILPLLDAGLVLDVGSGDGSLAQLLMQQRPEIKIFGLEVGIRPITAVPTVCYGESNFPFSDGSFSTVICVDMLHHTQDPALVLRECLRVARNRVVVKDHLQANPIDTAFLRFLDWVGNVSHGVELPYLYFTHAQWDELVRNLGAKEVHHKSSIPRMYPPLFQRLLGEGIQFVSAIQMR